MTELVAIAIPGGDKFVESIVRAWGDGNAFCVLDSRLPKPEAGRQLKALGATCVLDEGGLTRLPKNRLPPLEDDDALVLATSGSMGEPKAVVHTHASIAASAHATSAALAVDPTVDRWLACLPLSHIGGLSVVLRALVTGCPVTVHPRFDPTEVVRAASAGVSLISVVAKTLSQIDPSLFRMILTGGSSAPINRPSNVVATYGMTETGSGIVYQRPDSTGGFGQTVLDGAELKVDKAGEILVRGPMLFRGYRQHKDPFCESGWYPTADYGRWGPSGKLIVEGRRGDVIITGGEKVWPARTEAILQTMPEIDDVVVTGVIDPDWGEQVVAFITLNGHSSPSLNSMRALVKSELPVWYAPKRVEVRDSFERSASGKTLRNKVKPDES